MSTFFLKNTSSIEPIPNVKQNSEVTDFGSYGSSFDMTFNSNTGSNTSRIIGTYFMGQDNATHISEPQTWITPFLKGGTFNGSWSADIVVRLNANPNFVLSYAKAAIWVWNYADSIQERIGDVSAVVPLDASFTSRNFSFGSDTITIQDGDRIYLEVWAEIHDNTDETGSNLTPRVWYNSTTYNSTITTPGVQEQFFPTKIRDIITYNKIPSKR